MMTVLAGFMVLFAVEAELATSWHRMAVEPNVRRAVILPSERREELQPKMRAFHCLVPARDRVTVRRRNFSIGVAAFIRVPVQIATIGNGSPREPHRVHHDSELARYGNLSLLHAGTLGEPDAPGFERRPLLNPCEQRGGRFE